MGLFELVGIFGAALILVGFLARHNKEYGVGTMRHVYLNVVGAALLVLYSWVIDSWPFLALNGVWLVDAVMEYRKLRR